METAGRVGGGVERPDLHPGDPLGEKALGELAGPALEEGVEVLVRPLFRVGVGESPVLRHLGARRPHVPVAGAGVVGADRRAGHPAQEVHHGPPRRLAEEVPERDVEGRVGPGLDSGRARADVIREREPEPVDGRRVPAEEAPGRGLVDVGGDGLGAEEGLAEAHQPLVGVKADEAEVGELAELDCLDGGHAHGTLSRARGLTRSRCPASPRPPSRRAPPPS